MRIIRLQIQHRTSPRNIEISKHAVSLDTKNHNKIKHFINHVKKICNLKQYQWQLTIDGFAISQNDMSKILREHVVYRLRPSLKHKDAKRLKEKEKKVESQSEQNLDSESLEQSQVERQIYPQEKEVKRLSKIRSKSCKINQKRKQSSSSSPSSSSDSESSGSSDSSDSESEVKNILVKRVKEDNQKIKNQLQKRKIKQTSKIVQKIDKKQTKKKDEVSKEVKVNPTKTTKPLLHESSSDSSESEDLQLIGDFKQLHHKKQTVPLLQQKINTIIEKTVKPTTVKNRQQENNTSKLQLFKKKIIEGDSSSSQSDDTPVKQIKIADKKPTTIQSINEQKELNSQQKEQKNTKLKIAQSKLPPALRNKLAKKNFEQHKKNQWLTVDKEKLKKWQDKGFSCFSQPKNKIRFKIIELDEEKFIPVKSEWITGQVKSTAPDGKIFLINVQQEGQKFRTEYELHEHNMDELQIYRLLASKEQIQCLEDGPHPQNNQTLKPVIQNIPEPENTQPNNNKGIQDKNSVQKFICGQVHFYFSDKNYFTDLYMQMHANRHPQKYLNISFLLNFPKIKKHMRDENKLLQYLKEDPKYEQRNYQIDFVQKIIRKKIAKAEAIPNQQQIKPALAGGNETSGNAEVKLTAREQQQNE